MTGAQTNDTGFGFVPQQAAGAHAVTLFGTRTDFQRALERVVEHITTAICREREVVPAMTFALHAPWGSGKSTALDFIQHLVLAKVGERAVVRFGRLEASRWHRGVDARSALAYTVARAFAGQNAESAAALLTLVTNLSAEDGGRLPAAGRGAQLAMTTALVRLLDGPAGTTPMLEDWLAAEVSADNSWYVILIDDVDRSSPEFTAALLQACTHWATNDGGADGRLGSRFFFIVASGEEHLLEAMEHVPGGRDRPQEALQKYVQLRVDLPTFFSTHVEIAQFLAGVIDAGGPVAPGTVAAEVRARLGEVIASPARTGTMWWDEPTAGVLAPALRVDRATPRRAKDDLNRLLREYPRTSMDLAAVKKAVIRAFWPDFWWDYLYSLQGDAASADQVKLARARAVREVGRQFQRLWEQPTDKLREAFDASLAAISGGEGELAERFDPHLAIYLSLRPLEPPDDQLGMIPARDAEDRGRLPAEHVRALPTGGDKLADESGTRPESSVRDWGSEALRLYLESEQAGDDPDGRVRGLASLERLAGLAERGFLTESSAITIGNAAVNAESWRDLGLARRLYEHALRLDPMRWGVAQNYVDFIVGSRQEALFPRAEELLARLRGPGAAYRPDRTEALGVRLATARDSTADASTAVEHAVERIRAQRTLDSLLSQVRLLRETGAYDQLVAAGRLVAEHAGSDADRYTVLRVLADSLANSQDNAHKTVSADLFRYLLRSGLACLAGSTASEDADAIRHNLATLYNRLDQKPAAMAIWRDLYGTGRADDIVRRSFALALSDGDSEHQRAALAVLEGQPISLPDSGPPEVPARLSAGEPWWDGLPTQVRQPCGTSWLES